MSDLDALWNYDDPSGSESRIRALLERDLAPAVRIEALARLARAEGLQRRFPDGHRTLDEAERLAEADRDRATIALERGRLERSAGAVDASRPFFRDAWELAVAAGADGLAVDAAHMIAIVSDPDDAIAWNERALALAESSCDPDARRWVGSLANNLGWVYHERGEAAVALTWFERALAARRAEHDVPRERIARWTVARSLRSLGRVEEALELQRDLAAELDAAGEPDGYVFEEIGECLHALERSDDARPWFARAYVELARDPSLVDSEPERLERLRSLGGS